MARPKTHGSPVSFRLPLEYDELLTQRATEQGESTTEYVRRVIMRSLDGRRSRPRNGLRPRVTPTLERDKVDPIPKKRATKSAAK